MFVSQSFISFSKCPQILVWVFLDYFILSICCACFLLISPLLSPALDTSDMIFPCADILIRSPSPHPNFCQRLLDSFLPSFSFPPPPRFFLPRTSPSILPVLRKVLLSCYCFLLFFKNLVLLVPPGCFQCGRLSCSSLLFFIDPSDMSFLCGLYPRRKSRVRYFLIASWFFFFLSQFNYRATPSSPLHVPALHSDPFPIPGDTRCEQLTLPI